MTKRAEQLAIKASVEQFPNVESPLVFEVFLAGYAAAVAELRRFEPDASLDYLGDEDEDGDLMEPSAEALTWYLADWLERKVSE